MKGEPLYEKTQKRGVLILSRGKTEKIMGVFFTEHRL